MTYSNHPSGIRRIRINPAFNKTFYIGIIPLSQLKPIGLIGLFSFIVAGVLGGDVPHFLGIAVTLSLAWIRLTGDKPYKQTDRLTSPPGTEWINTPFPYVSADPQLRSTAVKKFTKDQDLLPRLPIIKEKQPGPKGKTKYLFPMANSTHLVAPVLIEKDGRRVAGHLLENKIFYQVVFLLKFDPWHNSINDAEAEALQNLSSRAVKKIIYGESIKFHLNSFAYDLDRLEGQKVIADRTQNNSVKALFNSEIAQTRELTKSKKRQNLESYITITHTWYKSGAQIGQTVDNSIASLIQKALDWFTEDRNSINQQTFGTAYEEAYQAFCEWESILAETWKLRIAPTNHEEVWQRLFTHFNGYKKAPPLSAYHYWDGNTFEERVFKDRLPLSVILDGHVDSIAQSTPKHKNRGDELILPGRKNKIAILVLDQASNDFDPTPQEQLTYISRKLEELKIHDIEIVVELNPQKAANTKSKLGLQLKKDKRRVAAAINREGGDVFAEEELSATAQAQRQLSRGGIPVAMGFAIVVYRPTSAELDQACRTIAGSFNEFRLIREENRCYSLWLETKSLLLQRLLHNTSSVQDRRLSIDTDSFTRFLPLVVPQDADPQGVELIDQTGKPICLALHELEQPQRGLVIGDSGSGKSMLLWRCVLQALAQNIPAIIIDASGGNNSSFISAAKAIGGAHIISDKTKLNLLHPPNLNRFKGEDYTSRLGGWQNSVNKTLNSYVLFGIEYGVLSQRVEVLIAKTTQTFINNDDIKERINAANVAGYGSPEWQNTPTLRHWLQFCTREKLGLEEYEELDKQAINQIRVQIKALLSSPTGQLISQPSEFDPDNLLTIFTLTNVASASEELLLAQVTQSLALRTALSAPKSLIAGDEVKKLLQMRGFADIWSDFYGMGRKNGVALLTTSLSLYGIAGVKAAKTILENTSWMVVGRLADGSPKQLKDFFDLPDLIFQNTSESFQPNKVQGYTSWFVSIKGKYWISKFFPSKLNFGLIANNPQELLAKQEILGTSETGSSYLEKVAQYSQTL